MSTDHSDQSFSGQGLWAQDRLTTLQCSNSIYAYSSSFADVKGLLGTKLLDLGTPTVDLGH